jgi:hypothetical protein
LITHNDVSQSVGLLWTNDQLVSETSTWQHTTQTNIHASGGIRPHDLSKRAATDLRLRPRGYWDRLYPYYIYSFQSILWPILRRNNISILYKIHWMALDKEKVLITAY